MADMNEWTSKLDVPPNIAIKPMPVGRKNVPTGQLMLLPNGRVVDDAIRAIPRGEATAATELGAALARTHGAEITCPVTTGFCLRTGAEAAYEALAGGTPIEEVTSVWRVLDARSSTLKKVSFDPAFILEQRAREA